jgi:hypothetical protein
MVKAIFCEVDCLLNCEPALLFRSTKLKQAVQEALLLCSADLFFLCGDTVWLFP